jgi:hypothetical protein
LTGCDEFPLRSFQHHFAFRYLHYDDYGAEILWCFLGGVPWYRY